MTRRSSYGFLDYETGVERPKVRKRKLGPPDDAPSLFAPIVPAARTADPPTSNDGIRDVLPRAGSQQHRLLVAYAARPLGLTNEEAAAAAGLRVVGCCYWKRCAELFAAGLVEDTLQTRIAETGSEQRVLAITAKGQRALEARRT